MWEILSLPASKPQRRVSNRTYLFIDLISLQGIDGSQIRKKKQWLACRLVYGKGHLR